MACSNKEAAKKYIGKFCDFINAGGYLPQQVFNSDETGLFWKKMPNRTYIAKKEKFMPGHKSMKDKITILVYANASCDCKIKPMAIYLLDNPRMYKRNKVMTSKLPIMWQSNHKSWCT